ncbi:hypothetical protein HN011_003507 [Eciton burchellii]|nr:hypothetical protein HN011_003507 [Eciton burchellii]
MPMYGRTRIRRILHTLIISSPPSHMRYKYSMTVRSLHEETCFIPCETHEKKKGRTSCAVSPPFRTVVNVAYQVAYLCTHTIVG